MRVAADTFRPNPDFSTEEVITQLGIGEALVSVLEDRGVPSIVGRTLIRPPSGSVGPISPEQRRTLIATSPVAGIYDTAKDRESAFEVLTARQQARQQAEAEAAAHEELVRQAELEAKAERARDKATVPRRSTRQSPTEAALSSFARTVANRLGSALVRGILGSLTRGR